MGLGVQHSDMVSIPTWLNNAFGEYIMTTEEILTHESSGNAGQGDTPLEGIADSADLQRGGN
jgi:hypothetical protein